MVADAFAPLRTVTLVVRRCLLALGVIGMSACSSAPDDVAPPQTNGPIVQIATGTQRSCAVRDDGAVICWGYNEYGGLGDGSTTDRSAPVLVAGLPGPATSVSVGFSHACAIVDDGRVSCWGRNVRGELGDGSTTDRPRAVVVQGRVDRARHVDADGLRTCAVLEGGTVVCWGHNWNGELGDGSTTDRSVPVLVAGLSGPATSVSVGFSHACAIVDDGAVACWGYNEYGGLGDGSTTDRSVPVLVAGLPGPATSVSVGDGHTCAIVESGALYCWGYNEYGGLGDGSTTDRSVPVLVSGLPGSVIAVSAGYGHTCAIVESGALYCWGYNEYGGLGDGSTTDRSVPVLVSGFPGPVVSVSAGDGSTCSLTENGSGYCWGRNQHGELGDGTRTDRRIPTAVGLQ